MVPKLLPQAGFFRSRRVKGATTTSLADNNHERRRHRHVSDLLSPKNDVISQKRSSGRFLLDCGIFYPDELLPSNLDLGEKCNRDPLLNLAIAMMLRLSLDVLLAVCLTALIFCDASSAMVVSSPAEVGCAVVGCGVLGTSLCKQLIGSADCSSWKVTGITKTTANHVSILEQVGESERFAVKTSDECKGDRYQNVVFCAPPSGFDDYSSAVEDAITNLWTGPSEGGVFIFTSSGGIYGDSGRVVSEDSPVADPEKNPRVARLIYAEEAVRKNGGACLRLAGLYSLDRGAHNFWFMSGKPVKGREDGIINQLHYDDAAGAVLAALISGPSVVNRNNFLISDGSPMTRLEICESALKTKKFQKSSMPSFLGNEKDPIGKVYNGAASNKALKWDPRYKSFAEFMSSHA